MLASLILSAFSALFLWAAFPPLGLWPLVFIAFVPFIFLINKTISHRAAFGWGWLAGLLFFLAVLQWIHHVTIPGLVSLCVYLAVYQGLFGLCSYLVRPLPALLRAGVLAAAFVLLEFIRAHAFTGFNWGSPAHALAPVAWLRAIDEKWLSAVIIVPNVLAAQVLAPWPSGSARREALRDLGIGVVVVLLCVVFNMPLRCVNPGRVLSVALIQPNISLERYWDPANKKRIVEELLSMSRESLAGRPQLIIWPETSFPQFIWQMPDMFERVKEFSRQNNVSILVGAVTRDSGRYYNSALLLTPDGRVQTYSKRHLVVFGEYIPFRAELPFLERLVPIDDFSAGSDQALLELPDGTKFGVLICFEDTIASLAARDRAKGARFLVNMTNDAWFGDSGQPRMHLYNAALRASQTGLPLVRATNTGESCLVAARGAIGPCVEDEGGKRTLRAGLCVVRVELR